MIPKTEGIPLFLCYTYRQKVHPKRKTNCCPFLQNKKPQFSQTMFFIPQQLGSLWRSVVNPLLSRKQYGPRNTIFRHALWRVDHCVQALRFKL